jgi:hypothetical protein
VRLRATFSEKASDVVMASPATVSPVTEVIEFFARAPSREDIATFHLSPAAHQRLRDLLDRNAAGALTADEERELDQMVLLDDILSLIRARAQGVRPPG